MSHLVRVLFYFLTFASSAESFAQVQSIEGLKSIELLQQNLSKQHKSKPARTLKEAFRDFRDGKLAEAIYLGSKIQKNEAFSDYGYWITENAFRDQAQDRIEKKNFKDALKSAQKAIELSLQIERQNPYSPFIRTLSKELAQSELLIGAGNWGLRQWSSSQKAYEKAFQRLQTQNMLVLISPDDLSHYAESCKKKQGPLCLGWLQKLSILFIKKSEEINAISEHFPEMAKIAKSPRIVGKVTVGYRAPDLDQSAYEAALKLYFEEKYGQAAKTFRQFLDDFPRSAYRFKARYWLAQALAQEQDHEKAQKLYEELQQETPLSYYGLLASYGSGKPIDSAVDATPPLASETDPSLQPQEMIHLQRAQNFIAEKAYELASFELKELKYRDGLSSPFLVYLAMLHQQAKSYPLCFQILGELIQRGYGGIFSSYGLKMIFPMDYFEIIKKYSTQNGLDPILVLSLIKQESAFDEEIHSPVGATGLMQLMPATATETDPNVSLSDLLTAEENIRVGTKYLKKVLNRFNGNIVLALAGYNAGPNAAERWIKDKPAKRGMLEFIESIPYKETRDYVASIIRNYFWYSRRLNGISPKGLNYFWNVYGPPESPLLNPNPSPSPELAKPQNGNA
jgi:soluble lytic murein transglycosylase-like protein